jgi:SEFIR domain
MDMEHRHRDALQRIYQAEQIWSEQGNPERSFLLLHTGGMQSHVDHPGWEEPWPVPSEHTIDDLAEMGMLRVDPSLNKARTFALTVAGRQSVAELLSADVAPALPSASTAQLAASTVPPGALANPTALLSWAHDTATWQTTLVEFAVLLRRYGVDADIDLFELHNPNVNWSTWGPDAIERSEFVLLAVSANYRERWEDRGDQTEGAGAAREANVLKTLFNQDRAVFYHKVKIVILPGASVQDIPAELGAAAQRFELQAIDAASLEDLLRTLTGQPAFPRPELGEVHVLPARVFVPSEGLSPQTAGDTIELLRARLRELETERTSPTHREGPEQNELDEEQTTLQAALQALTVISGGGVGALAAQLVDSGGTSETVVPTLDERRMLEVIYAVFTATARWPKFQHVSLTLWEATADPRETYHQLSAKGLVRPPIDPRHGFQLREDTEVAVSLLGLTYLREATEDLSIFTAAVRYIAGRAVSFRAPSPTEVGWLTVTSEELRLALQLDDGLALSRAGRLIADELPVWSSFGDPAVPIWQFEVVPERARRYRDIYTVIDVMAIRSGRPAGA